MTRTMSDRTKMMADLLIKQAQILRDSGLAREARELLDAALEHRRLVHQQYNGAVIPVRANNR